MCGCRPLVVARRVGGDLHAVPAELHTAPASGALFAGVIKVPHTSGTLADPITIRMREQGCGVISEQWARAYHEQQRQPGKGHHTAVQTLAFKWIRVVFRCWKNGVA